METEDKVLAALQQLLEDIKELTRVIMQNYQGVVSQNAGMKRLYITVIVLAFGAWLLYPWIQNHLH
jgi:hypothetical protein